MSLFLFTIIFFHASQQSGSVCAEPGAELTTSSWSKWSHWSDCNTYDIARRTRFRKCLHFDGKVLNLSHCSGLSKRTRQCESCAFPILSHHNVVRPSSWTVVRDITNISNTAWCSPQKADGSKYVEMSFKNFVQLTAIATWGHEHGYIKKYKLKYSYDGETWFSYPNKIEENEFLGNIDVTRLRKNIFRTRLVTRYIRVYPTTSTAHACFKMRLYGCEYNCGGLITRDATLVRPPSAYMEELECLWRVQSKAATKLQLKFQHFRLFCEDGVLELFDGRKSYNPDSEVNLIEAFCGRSNKVSSQIYEGKNMWLYYRSNATTADTGFKIKINTYVVKTTNITSANVIVPKKNSFSNIYRYSWTIIAPRDNDTIELTLHYFDSNNTRTFAGICVADAIIIHYGNQRETLVQKYCDTKNRKVFKSTNGFFKIKYKSKTNNPKWKVQYSYKMIGYPAITTASTMSQAKELFSILKGTESSTREIPSSELNSTNLDATYKNLHIEHRSSKVPIIVSCVIALLIAIVCIVALLHYLKQRHLFLRKHPYDCSNRPLSHFGDEDATPFINTNLLTWSDSKKSKDSATLRSFEKSKKSLPVVEVTLRENEPQRLSIIPPEMLQSSSELSLGMSENEENKTGSLKVSDNFTEECMKMLNNTLSTALAVNEKECNEKIELLPGMSQEGERYASLAEPDRRSSKDDHP